MNVYDKDVINGKMIKIIMFHSMNKLIVNILSFYHIVITI